MIITDYKAYMELASQPPEHGAAKCASMPDRLIKAIGTLLAATVRLLWQDRHWLHVAVLLKIVSKVLALVMIALIRSVRARALAVGCESRATFEELLKHLSCPPSRWAGA